MATPVRSSAELTAVENLNAAWYALLVTSRASADLQICATWVESVAQRRHFYFAETQDSAAFGAIVEQASAALAK